MLKLYYNRISFNSSRVWIALLEKGLPFELVPMKLNGDQFQPEFLALNPFHQIPVLEDDGFVMVESLAILDYLEAKYPTPSLLPSDPQMLGTVKMIEILTLTQMMPPMRPLMMHSMGFSQETPEKLQEAKQNMGQVLRFFESKLADRLFFGDEQLTLADIVAGTAIPFLPSLGVPLEDYPQLKDWCDRLMARESWQQTQPTEEEITEFKTQLKILLSQRR
ncbi:glutathione S-transferase family protein [Laspinema olomoucense]|uniref:glutathione S-transferase family protein n=1 Tax=Laspinema olomoucense TaxID=3231600 RepID=UPI0021BA6AC6|nr:glutathione S-transferase family protein [Laspinema sp. D3a]MCT7987550.1 glutathione S-transferase family protein [Laspinema sp. D3a]